MELSLGPHLQISQSSQLPAQPICASAVASHQTRTALCIVGAAFIGLLLKFTIAYNTLGTNDAVSFYIFARSLHDHGLQWTYLHGAEWLPNGAIFNHPPLTAYYLEFIDALARNETLQAAGITFPFLLRAPGIIADFVVVLALLRLGRREHLPVWALLLFALSPVSLMVSGFHGNTDSVMAMFLVLATVAGCEGRPAISGVLLALSCQVKVIPLLFLPIFLLFLTNRGGGVRFSAAFLLTCAGLWWQPLVNFPVLFFKNVLFYGSFWGNWGITYWLRLTQFPAFSRVSFMNLSQAQVAVATLLKAAIVAAVWVLAWRRRTLQGFDLFKSIGFGWLIFFALSPGVCPQYMVWLAPFVLFISPRFYVCLTAASALYVFCFYNITSQGLPWFLAVSKNQHNDICAPWGLWPWAAIVIGLIVCWRNARTLRPSLRLLSFQTLADSSAVTP